jgi:hypothetical protein
VQLADGIGPSSEPQREGRHVELGPIVLDADAELEQLVDRDAAGRSSAVTVEEGTRDAAHEVGGEALVARGDRSVDREDAVAPDPVPRLVQGVARGDVLAGAFREEQR